MGVEKVLFADYPIKLTPPPCPPPEGEGLGGGEKRNFQKFNYSKQ